MPYKLEDIQDKIKMKDIEKSMSNGNFNYSETIIEGPVEKKPAKKKTKSDKICTKNKEDKKKDKFEIFFIRIAMIIGLILVSALLTAVIIKLISLMFA